MKIGSRRPPRHSSDQKHAPYPDTGLESRRGGARPPYNRREPGRPQFSISLMRSSQGHGDSGPVLRYGGRNPEGRGGKTTANLWLQRELENRKAPPRPRPEAELRARCVRIKTEPMFLSRAANQMNPHLGPSNDKRGTLCARSAYSVTRPDLLPTHPMPVAELASFCGRCRLHQYQVRPQDRAIALYNLVFAKQTRRMEAGMACQRSTNPIIAKQTPPASALMAPTSVEVSVQT